MCAKIGTGNVKFDSMGDGVEGSHIQFYFWLSMKLTTTKDIVDRERDTEYEGTVFPTKINGIFD